MKEKLRIVFMGTPDFAVGILDALIQNHYLIVGVITAPDKPAGRGRKLQESAVKKYALEHNLKVLQPTNLKSNAFITELKSLKAHLQIVVAFRMLPKMVWELPSLGTFNLHASLLPDYRGAAPINWAIINGETTTGVSTFFIDDKIDTGEIILQSATSIAPNETAGSLHDKLMVLGAQVVLKTVQILADGSVETTQQNNTKMEKVAYKINKETCEIKWNKPLTELYNHIRGLSPYPAAWTTLHTDTEKIALKIFEAKPIIAQHTYPLKKVLIDKKTMKVAVAEGFLELLTIQLPGKRKMTTQEVLNGVHFGENLKMG